ncbi:hypothetical protein HYH03_014225 [Edaphochlamys debaryana]|uniref:histone acetyltransferase n=1 Tax=Edaphochlamys debaryana TaxID=47281 RepID=A0A835XLN8_9CHLO|nr:hypothetical protein HYH03_014225 [Edaphochlamys debaryana]|eukprot:KAG2487112.1 hypothetical protein HYH03_014225 [Edaphochlamys debaryana]
MTEDAVAPALGEAGQPQPKRARIAPAPLQATSAGPPAALGPSSTTGTTLAPPPLPAPVKPAPQALAPASGALPSGVTTTTASVATAPAQPTADAKPAAKPAPAAGVKPSAVPASAFIADAHEAVRFRALTCSGREALLTEIEAGGAPVSVDFLHQHFGDSEQIRGYSGLVITIWMHVPTWHTWIDIQYDAKRPGADPLSSIFEGAYPCGYCRTKDDFLSAVLATAAALPDLASLGQCAGRLTLTAARPAALYGCATTAAAGAGASGKAAGAAVEVAVRRFQLCNAPQEVKALHQRLEPLLLFTIDGANFIDDEDPSWELLLPVARAPDGGCLVLGLATLFNFYAYPASCRLRVSQVLVVSPWQGLGLGKALLRLSYDLASKRGCADLTVEDPTPNLQRVREKLEVEMMRGLPWLAQQADKCLAAAAEGRSSWPGCASRAPTPAPAPSSSALPASSSAPTQAAPAQPAEAQAEPMETDGPAAGAQADAAQAQAGPAQAQAQGHPLLSEHAFFAALGAAPPEGKQLPSDVAETAAAAAAEKWRRRLAEAEAAAAAALAAEAAAAGPSAAPAAEAEASGTEAAGSASADPLCGALLPPGDFLSAVSRELRMHRGQVRVVWEALLWCAPGARRPRAQAALEDLVRRRLESQHFSSVGRAAASKRLVDCPPPKPGSAAAAAAAAAATGEAADAAAKPAAADPPAGVDESGPTNFFMYRVLPGRTGGTAAATAEGGSDGSGANGSGSGSAAPAADTGAIATGRLNLTQVTVEDKAARMEELMDERRQQLDSLAEVLSRPAGLPRRRPNASAAANAPKPDPPAPRPTAAPSAAAAAPAPVSGASAASGAAPAGAGAGAGAEGGAVKKKAKADVAAMMRALEGRM